MKFLKLVILHDVFIARLSLYKERAFSFSFNVSAETPLTTALTAPAPSYLCPQQFFRSTPSSFKVSATSSNISLPVKPDLQRTNFNN